MMSGLTQIRRKYADLDLASALQQLYERSASQKDRRERRVSRYHCAVC